LFLDSYLACSVVVSSFWCGGIGEIPDTNHGSFHDEINRGHPDSQAEALVFIYRKSVG
jgi:hypothetical protein